MLNKRSILFTVLLSFLFTAGCAGAADYDVELPGDYSILRTSAHQVTIAPKTGETSWGANKIPAKVIEAGWNEEFIIAKQANLVKDPQNSSSVEIPEEKKHSYWILEIENGAVTGPLNDRELAKQKEELKISEEIILKKIEELKSDK